jgi:hypothetical protein
MKSIDKLREWSCHTDLHEIADEIEAEIAANYLELPKDADGVPIRVGDVIVKKSGDTFTVRSVAPESFHAGGMDIIASAVRHHVKPRTLEDVIEGAINAAFGNEAPFSAIAKKAADEIRELLGGDA